MSIKKAFNLNIETTNNLNSKVLETEPDAYSSQGKGIYSSKKKIKSESSESKESSVVKYKNSCKK